MKKIFNYQLFFANFKVVSFLIVLFAVVILTGFVNAQSGVTSPTGNTGSGVTNPTSAPATSNSAGNISPTSVDINKSTFKLLICDGPEELRHYNPATNKIEPNFTNDKFIACDFKGLMMQLQHFINIAMVLGVLIAIVGFTWAGALYISGQPKNIDKAHDIFPSIFKGFIIMLSAWFVVYQILAWLTGTSSFGVLLGK